VFVIVGRIASALGHIRLTDRQRVRAQRVIHYALGTSAASRSGA
jgi:hypothetical protein